MSADKLSEEEKRLLRDSLVRGSEVDPVPRIPDAPDIAVLPVKTYRDRIEGLRKLTADEVPVVGEHFVVWGSKLLDDIYARPVRKAVGVSESDYALQMRREAEAIVSLGVKNPLHQGLRRGDRAEAYARWRYKGYVCGEVVSL